VQGDEVSADGRLHPVAGDLGSSAPHTIDTRAPEAPRGAREILREVVLVLPHLAVLLARLIRDPRVPRRRKLLVGMAIAYVASPLDALPDVIPVVGQFDDAIVVAFAIHHLMRAVPAEVRADYWAGSEDAFDLVQAVVAWGAEMVPSAVRRMVGI
jgi:uncharacterized membrane protein YkvA (DUF1232 family)